MKRIVALGGEGIGPEVVDATCELLIAAGFPVEILTPPHGEATLKSHGTPLPEETKRLCYEADGVLFGAAGGPGRGAHHEPLRRHSLGRGRGGGGRPRHRALRVYRDGKALTPDQGGTATTKEFAQAVLAALRNG